MPRSPLFRWILVFVVALAPSTGGAAIEPKDRTSIAPPEAVQAVCDLIRLTIREQFDSLLNDVFWINGAQGTHLPPDQFRSAFRRNRAELARIFRGLVFEALIEHSTLVPSILKAAEATTQQGSRYQNYRPTFLRGFEFSTSIYPMYGFDSVVLLEHPLRPPIFFAIIEAKSAPPRGLTELQLDSVSTQLSLSIDRIIERNGTFFHFPPDQFRIKRFGLFPWQRGFGSNSLGDRKPFRQLVFVPHDLEVSNQEANGDLEVVRATLQIPSVRGELNVTRALLRGINDRLFTEVAQSITRHPAEYQRSIARHDRRRRHSIDEGLRRVQSETVTSFITLIRQRISDSNATPRNSLPHTAREFEHFVRKHGLPCPETLFGLRYTASHHRPYWIFRGVDEFRVAIERALSNPSSHVTDVVDAWFTYSPWVEAFRERPSRQCAAQLGSIPFRFQ